MIGDVGEDRRAAGRDFVFREEEEQAGEEIVDGYSGTKFLEVSGEGNGGVGSSRWFSGRRARLGQKAESTLEAERRQRLPLAKR